MTVDHGVVVLATGGHEHRPDGYLLGKNKKVVTQMELEKRLAERDGISQEAAATILANQLSIEEKKSYADYVINNEGTIEETREKVEELWEELKKLQQEMARKNK